MQNPCNFVIRSLFINVLIGAIGVVFMTSAGCHTPSARDRVGVATYVRGDLEASLANGFDPVVDATHQAIKELGFIEISTKKDALNAVITARSAGDRKIEIAIASPGKDLTNMRIRVDLFGDEQLSRSLLNKIKAGL